MPTMKVKNNGVWEPVVGGSQGGSGNIDIDLDDVIELEPSIIVKPQSPLYHKTEDAYFYPLTTADQVMLENGDRLSVKFDTLVDKVNTKATSVTLKGMLSATGWSSSAPFEQAISIAGILSTDYPFVDIDLSEASDPETVIEDWGKVGRVTIHSDDSIIAYCYKEKPSVDIPMVFKVVR